MTPVRAAKSSSPACSHKARTSHSAFPASYLAVLDAIAPVLRERFRFVICRQEGGAAYMAEASGKLTGRPGLAFVTRGPGAANAAIGIHTAAQDSTPMIVFVGQVGSDMIDREAFQEIDYRRRYGSVSKWAAQIDRAERIPEYLAHAYRTAMSGRPGPSCWRCRRTCSARVPNARMRRASMRSAQLRLPGRSPMRVHCWPAPRSR
jgi:acetolactate synthase-1/2/3 large subunit